MDEASLIVLLSVSRSKPLALCNWSSCGNQSMDFDSDRGGDDDMKIENKVIAVVAPGFDALCPLILPQVSKYYYDCDILYCFTSMSKFQLLQLTGKIKT